MNKQTKITATDEAWDNGELGRDEQHVKKASAAMSALAQEAIDSSLELQAISIRLPKSLIEEFKLIAEYRGLSYQPLMRQILNRFATSETKLIMRELIEKESKTRSEREERKCA